jgi:hypothetical protein
MDKTRPRKEERRYKRDMLEGCRRKSMNATRRSTHSSQRVIEVGSEVRRQLGGSRV